MSAVTAAAALQDVRHTDCGLRAVWDPDAELWRYYRLNWRTDSYEETGSTLEFQP